MLGDCIKNINNNAKRKGIGCNGGWVGMWVPGGLLEIGNWKLDWNRAMWGAGCWKLPD